MSVFKLERLPTLYRRTFAFILDLLVVDCLRHAFFVAYSACIYTYFPFLRASQKHALMDNLIRIDMAVFLLVFMAYFTAVPFLSQGKTLGKMILGLKIEAVESEGELSDFTRAFLRAMGQVVAYLSIGTLFFIAYFRKDQRSLADFMAGTKVIDHLPKTVLCPVINLRAASTDHDKKAA